MYRFLFAALVAVAISHTVYATAVGSMSLTAFAYSTDVTLLKDAGNPLWWYLLGLGAATLITVCATLLMRRGDTEIIAGFEIESDG